MTIKPLTPELSEKESILKNLLKPLGRVCVAFSGGVDSTLLLKLTHDTLKDDCLAITADGAMMPRSEFEESQSLAATIGVTPMVIPMDVFRLTGFYENPTDRCYHCKKYIFSQLKKAALEKGCTAILDGTNLDDTKDYRPGIRALKELSVISPFVEAGLTKAEIRSLSAFYGLPTADKPSMACLATRIPAGTPITEQKLKQVELGEEQLKALGLSQYRLRLIGDTAKIECPIEDFKCIMANRSTLVNALHALGLKTITLDLEGYETGKMNVKGGLPT